MSRAPAIDGLDYVRLLGEGGQASVYQYQQRIPARAVAVKVLRDPLASADDRSRFLAEAHDMASLEHPYIVPVFWAGVTAEKQPYIVMQIYARGTLADRVARESLRLEEVLRLGIQVGSAVETAHRAGILHRDIKPQNILLNQFGTPGLSDFGIASRLGHDAGDRSLSLPWAPPEVFSGDAGPTAASDVYSLAMTMWFLLAGVSPFAGPTTVRELMDAIRTTQLPDTGRPDVPAALEGVLRAAMSKDPARRPRSAYDLVRQLQAVERDLYFMPTEPAWLDVDQRGASLSTAATILVRDLHDPVDPEDAPAPPARRRRRAWWVVPGVVVGVVLLLLGALSVGRTLGWLGPLMSSPSPVVSATTTPTGTPTLQVTPPASTQPTSQASAPVGFALGTCVDESPSGLTAASRVVDCAAQSAHARIEALASSGPCLKYRSTVTLDNIGYCVFPVIKQGDCIPGWVWTGQTTIYVGWVRSCSSPLPTKQPARPADVSAQAGFGYVKVSRVVPAATGLPNCNQGDLAFDAFADALGIYLCAVVV